MAVFAYVRGPAACGVENAPTEIAHDKDSDHEGQPCHGERGEPGAPVRC